MLYISALQFEDEGEYTVIVSNDAGIGEASINLDVQGIYLYMTLMFSLVYFNSSWILYLHTINGKLSFRKFVKGEQN